MILSLLHLSPYHPSEIIRLGCDLMNLLYVFDEYTDIADGEGVERIRKITLDALRHPEKPRPGGEHLLGEMTREFVSSLPSQSYAISPLPRFQVSGFAHRITFPLTITASPISSAVSTPIPPLSSVRRTIAPSANIVHSPTIFLFAVIRLLAFQRFLSVSLG